MKQEIEGLIAQATTPSAKKWKVFHLSSSNDAGDIILVHPTKPPKIIEIKSIDIAHAKPPTYYFSMKPAQHKRLIQLNKTISCYYFVYFIHGTGWKWLKVDDNMPNGFKHTDGLPLQDFISMQCGITTTKK